MATSLGILDRTPPPFFRQGTSALTKLFFFSALAILLMVADVRFQVTQPLRATVATGLHPLERALQVPVLAWQVGGEYLRGLQAAIEAEASSRRELALLAERASRVEQLTVENERLRALLALRPALVPRSQAAEILYEASDPYSRKVIIDRGSQQGVVSGSPVINEHGVLGQVTRVYPLSAEVTLLTDKDAVIPVLNSRTQARSVAAGPPLGRGDPLELRFMAGNADVQVGDLLTTSGVDGVYPPGLPVATITALDGLAEDGFARISLKPVAATDAVRHVLVLEPLGRQMPLRPAPEDASAGDPAAAAKPAAAR
jgi:rod shape-determining protein MreC